MDADAFRQAAQSAIEEIISYNKNIASLPVLPQIKPGYLAPQIPTSAPTKPQPWSDIQPDISSKIIPGLTHWQSPKFMAFFPACVTYPSIIGEMYSAAFTAPAFNWLCSPACTELETVVTDWMCQAFSLPPSFLSTSPNGGGGTIQGSASEAIVTCMVAARERYLHRKCTSENLQPNTPEWEDRISTLRGKLIALSSDQTHSSTAKGARIAGTRFRAIPTSYTDDLALTGQSLASTLAECAAQGLEPYYITLTLGTTSTCSVDDFASLAPILRQHPNIWVHVDAAYAGAALILPEYANKYSHHMSIADSFNMNMHKWLLVNFDASMLYVQNRTDLTRALSVSAPYYENKASDSGMVTDYRDWQIPLGRRFRALKIWFVVRTFGLEGMREHISRTIRLGELFAGLVGERRDLFEVVARPAFALTCFRLKPELFEAKAVVNGNGHIEEGVKAPLPDVPAKTPLKSVAATAAATNGTSTPTFSSTNGEHTLNGSASASKAAETTANTLTKNITDLINERGEVFLTGSTAGGKTFIRVVSGNANAEEKYIREAWEEILKVTEEVLGEWRRERGQP
ncbi:Aromatic-L-amino-acid decarboxylase [Cyphellophora attinorum]|uniref:Aromatic-L-amino-acid decarboxylase n=1 Tax=Cyphellophora attinorum TaxID=1664694 RepID=A0A0N0NQP4_9EURO|nr:Aromatic-L-amino-acid decarboxylase [Phialophora attinorum]KPI43939.1 Aromatic-L-amino-acid decarboxylase [Phialophora attinorum]